MSRTYIERFGYEKAKYIKDKIASSHGGKKRIFKNKELWRKNLGAALKGRVVWNKGKKSLQIPWNKKELPAHDIVNMYTSENLSSNKIAAKFNVGHEVILRILKENGIKIKGMRGFYKGKKLIDIVGEEKAKLRSEKISKKIKGRPCNWKQKISLGIKNYYKQNGCSNESRKKRSILFRKLWQNPEYRAKLVNKRKEYLLKHPEELIRLRTIQYPGNITKIEQKVLNFLRERFKEGKDFYFDKQDVTGKTVYRPDFQFPDQKIIIEIDGYYKHFTKEGYKKDKIREYYLKKSGWKIYRFNHWDIERNYLFEKTKNKIMELFKNG